MILLFYKYVWIEYPIQLQKWQQRLCASLKLTGRVIIAQEGINGTVGGDDNAIAQYQQAMHDHRLFSDIAFKQSVGSAEDFPRLSVVVKKEIVSLGIDSQQLSADMGGRHISPTEAHVLIENAPNNLVILDARNNYESRIGTFAGAITPDIDNFRELPHYIDTHLELFRDKSVLMFCTGGVRCERASAYLKQAGVAAEVLQIEGGIHMYAEEYPNGHFRGKNYVFDNRGSVPVTDDVVGVCEGCAQPYDTYRPCASPRCNRQLLLCPSCVEESRSICAVACRTATPRECFSA